MAGISADSSAAVMSLMVGLWRAQCAEVTHAEGRNERHKHNCQNSVINKIGPIHKEISGMKTTQIASISVIFRSMH
jgi:hypothetical protein